MSLPRRKTYADEASLYEYAIGALGRKMRSVAELRRLLRQRAPADQRGETLVELVITRLKDKQYLNDAAYATAYTSYRKENQKFGRRRVISDLKARGVQWELIEKAVETVYSTTREEQLARDYLRRKHLKKPADQKQAARILRVLLRAGFSGGTIMHLLKTWELDDNLLTIVEGDEDQTQHR